MATYFGLQHTLMALLSEASGIKDMIDSMLLICSARGHQTLVTILLGRGANINNCSWLGWTPLHLASAKGSLAMTKFLLDVNADVNKRHSPGSSTALQLAAENGYADILQALLEHGANVNIMRHDVSHALEFTALRLAVLMKDVASITVLLDGGADINTLHLNSHWLLDSEKTRLYKFRTTVLFDAVSQQQEVIAYLLLDRGADVTIGDATPLCSAVSERNGRMVTLLIKDGADLRVPGALKHFLERDLWYHSHKVFSEECFSAKILGQALVLVGNTPYPAGVAEILIKFGADINLLSINEVFLDYEHECEDAWRLENALEFTYRGGPLLDFPLLAACRTGNEPLVRLLLDRGAKTWGVEKETWLQETIRSNYSGKPSLQVYGTIIGSDDLRKILRKNAYPEGRIDILDRLERKIAKFWSENVLTRLSEEVFGSMIQEDSLG